MPQFYTLKIKFNDKENNPLYPKIRKQSQWQSQLQ